MRTLWPALLQGFSFLWRYVERRGHCQESMYNVGRALHQMGLTHLAVHYYQTALTFPTPSLEVCHSSLISALSKATYQGWFVDSVVTNFCH